MLAVFLALGAAISWGLSAVLVRMGLRHLGTRAGTLISLASGLLVTGTLVMALDFGALRTISWQTLALFAVIGTLNFPVGRFCNYMAMERLGVGRSTPLLGSSPLFAVIIAVVFTGESLRLATAIGVGLILTGLYVTVSAPRAGAGR